MIQLELTPEFEHLLESEAVACGYTSADLVTKLVHAHFSARTTTTRPIASADTFQIRDVEDARAWILSRNPHLLQNSPEDTDWQQLKEAGRRY